MFILNKTKQFCKLGARASVLFAATLALTSWQAFAKPGNSIPNVPQLEEGVYSYSTLNNACTGNSEVNLLTVTNSKTITIDQNDQQKIITQVNGTLETGDGYHGNFNGVRISIIENGITSLENENVNGDLKNDLTGGKLKVTVSEDNQGRQSSETCVVQPVIPQFPAGTKVIVSTKDQYLHPPDEDWGIGQATELALNLYGQQLGIEVEYENILDEDILDRIANGTGPDIYVFFQPSKIKALADSGQAFALNPDAMAATDANFKKGWVDFVAENGQVFATPQTGSTKSLVWYSPSLFAMKGYSVPTTLTELHTLEAQMRANGDVPWCVGLNHGYLWLGAGYPMTDWIEDLVLRRLGPEQYDRWVSNDLKFSSPEITAVFEELRDIYTTPGNTAIQLDSDGHLINNWVSFFQAYGTLDMLSSSNVVGVSLPYGGYGTVLDGACMMHKQSFQVFPAGTTLGPAGDANAFAFPSANPSPAPLIVGAEFATVLRDAPEVMAIVQHMSTPEFAYNKHCFELGGSVSYVGDTCVDYVIADDRGRLPTVRNADVSLFGPFLQNLISILSSAESAKFDGSDLMPPEVGSRIGTGDPHDPENGYFCGGAFWYEGIVGLLGAGNDFKAFDFFSYFLDVIGDPIPGPSTVTFHGKSLSDALQAIDNAYANVLNGVPNPCNIPTEWEPFNLADHPL